MPESTEPSQSPNNNNALDAVSLDAVIVGAGFAGLYMLHRLREQGLKAQIFEAGSGVGGTWFWNRYPGARVDIESMQYSYQFSDELQQEWEWSERYAPQAELLKYIDHVVERFDLGKDIRLNTRIESAIFDETKASWLVSTDGGDQLSAKYCIMATGCLSSANMPDIKGRDTFKGPLFHTGNWPQEDVDFSGMRVGVIGTGSSGIQAIPLIARQASQLTVFQRTANFSVPAYNQPLEPENIKDIKAHYQELRDTGKQQLFAFDAKANEKAASEMTPEEVKAELQRRWEMGGLNFMAAFADLLIDKKTNDVVAAFVKEKIAEKVNDPAIAELLTPKAIFGCKRLCVDTDYYATYNRDNVGLVDISTQAIDEIVPEGLVIEGKTYELDALVFATGFDAMTGSLNKIDIRGLNGKTLRDKWSAGPRNYLGLCSAGFPNLFTISGPGSPSVFTNMITSIEQHVEYIGDIITYMGEHKLSTINPKQEAEDQWVDHVQEVAGQTLFLGCSSWYLGANVPGKPRVFMPYLGFPPYVEKCNEVAENDYEGFDLA